ncbi:hypothetical protein SELMODRAFT_409318 [Selaginella moellendorffii]|uniref:Uncharacterized protein n=1 Tax=Selaginella moellendorffii TaxID=88036 RepID=D8RB25_SELML|nr:hypothetical protein SELMODRAFT_409318 [Selaginella moellendorffii]
MDWLGRLNGNPGVGKSAFLWYFLIRFGIQKTIRNTSFVVVFQSGNLIWEFTSEGQVSIHEKTEYPLSRLEEYLIDQKIESGDPLGSRDEFEALLGLWKLESKEMREEADRLLKEAGSSEPSDCRCIMYSKQSSPQLALLNEADQLDARIKATDLYYDWYGGIPRLLRQAAVDICWISHP